MKIKVYNTIKYSSDCIGIIRYFHGREYIRRIKFKNFGITLIKSYK